MARENMKVEERVRSSHQKILKQTTYIKIYVYLSRHPAKSILQADPQPSNSQVNEATLLKIWQDK